MLLGNCVDNPRALGIIWTLLDFATLELKTSVFTPAAAMDGFEEIMGTQSSSGINGEGMYSIDNEAVPRPKCSWINQRYQPKAE
ncbi:hypothetical protein J0S82_014735, partial [Galemys pyrenaicus]